MHTLNHRTAVPFLRLVSTVLLAACSSVPPSLPPPDTKQVDAWVIGGYLSEARRSISHEAAELKLASGPVAVEWTLPTQGSHLPLVVYLPGLAESARAGGRWRDAWAGAGYAVLSIGAGDEDRVPPDLQRRADLGPDGKPLPGTPQELHQRILDQRDALHEWARQRFEPNAAAVRLQRLAAVLDTLKAQVVQGASPAARADLQHVALAGFDAGAFTAMLAVGEVPASGWSTTPLPLPVQAVICLSPYADFGGPAFSQRYRQVQVPVLSVSGSSDVDSAGLVPAPFVRRAPYENLPGQASLLWLKSASHALLAGRPPAARGEAPGGGGLEVAGSPGDARGGNRRGGGIGVGGAGVGPSGEEESDASRQRQATDAAIDQAVVASTTTAFLDARLRQDPLARQWLAGDAARWVRPRGEFSTR